MESKLKRRTGEIIKKSQIARGSDGFEHISGYFQTLVNSNDFPSSAKKYQKLPLNSPFLIQQIIDRNKSKAKKQKYFSGLSISPIGSKKKFRYKRVKSENFELSNSGEDNFIEGFVDMIGSSKKPIKKEFHLENNTINLNKPENDFFKTFEKTSIMNDGGSFSSKKSKFLKSSFMKSLNKKTKNILSKEKENYNKFIENSLMENINNSVKESKKKEILRDDINSCKNDLKISKNEIFKNLNEDNIKVDLNNNNNKENENMIYNYGDLYDMKDKINYGNKNIRKDEISDKKNPKQDNSNLNLSIKKDLKNYKDKFNDNETSFNEKNLNDSYNFSLENKSSESKRTKLNSNEKNNSKNLNQSINSNKSNVNSILNIKLKKKSKSKLKKNPKIFKENFFANKKPKYIYKELKTDLNSEIGGKWVRRVRYPRIFNFYGEKVFINKNKAELILVDMNSSYNINKNKLTLKRENKNIKKKNETVDFGGFSAEIVQRSKNKLKYKMEMKHSDEKILSYTTNKLYIYLYKLHKDTNLLIKFGNQEKNLKKKFLQPGEKFKLEKNQYFSLENNSGKEVLLSIEVYNNN